MAGHGPAPKHGGEVARRRKNEKSVELSTSAAITAPPLPGGPWRTEVIRWYQVWAESPQASRFTSTDWQRLHMLAPLVAAYWEEPNVRVLGEIRLNESLLGATEADRARLRWDIKPAPTPVATAAERRERIRLA